ncbi:MAG: amidohydrolase family protein [Solirubrobacterales bacterium]
MGRGLPAATSSGRWSPRGGSRSDGRATGAGRRAEVPREAARRPPLPLPDPAVHRCAEWRWDLRDRRHPDRGSVWSPESAMAFMDSEGIALQMLSVSDPGVAFLDDANAAALARDCNDHVAGVIRDRPDRFGAFAVLPLQDPAAARVEAVRALDELELDGVGLLSNAKGKYLGDPIYADLLGELNARGAWVMVHPTAVGADDKPSYSIPDFVAEYPFDTTRAIMSLLFNDMFRRYPKIRWHFAHGGGTIAMLRFRLTALAGNAAQFGALLGLPAPAQNLTAEVPKRVLKRSFFDTALIADQPSLAAVKEMGGVDGMLFGSDWPFAYRLYEDQPVPGDPQPTLSEFFDNDERRAIDRLNARSELKRLKNIIPGK